MISEEVGCKKPDPRIFQAALETGAIGYAYPHPDFCQLIFCAEAGEHRPHEMQQKSEWEAGA